MSPFKNGLNIYLISSYLLKTSSNVYIVQELVGTREKIVNSTSDQIIKYGKFALIFLISFHHEIYVTLA